MFESGTVRLIVAHYYGSIGYCINEATATATATTITVIVGNITFVLTIDPVLFRLFLLNNLTHHYTLYIGIILWKNISYLSGSGKN